MECSFHFIFRFRTGQSQFYITDMFLGCGGHARLITETAEIAVPSVVAKLCSEQSCLKFVRYLRCDGLNLIDGIMKGLGAAIRDCKQRRCIVVNGRDSVCDLLEQVANPSKCSLKLGCWGEDEPESRPRGEV